MDLVLIRHGKPEVIEHDPNGADPGLTDLGHRQAEAMGAYLGNEHFDAIWASPQRRARETAAPLLGGRDLELQIDERIAEFDLGETSYGTGPTDAMRLTGSAADEMLARVRNPEFQSRVMAGMNHIIDTHKGQRVAVVCHGGTIAVALSLMLDVPNLVAKCAPSYTSVSRVGAASNGFRSLQSYNEAHWLPYLEE